MHAYSSLRAEAQAELAGLQQQLAEVRSKSTVGGWSDARLIAEVTQLRSQLEALRSALVARPIPASTKSSAVTASVAAPATEELSVRLEQALLSQSQTLEARRLAGEVSATLTRACRSGPACCGKLLGGGESGLWRGRVYVQMPPSLAAQGEVHATLHLGQGAAFDVKQEG